MGLKQGPGTRGRKSSELSTVECLHTPPAAARADGGPLGARGGKLRPGSPAKVQDPCPAGRQLLTGAPGALPARNLFYSQTTSIYDIINKPKHFGGKLKKLCLKSNHSLVIVNI